MTENTQTAADKLRINFWITTSRKARLETLRQAYGLRTWTDTVAYLIDNAKTEGEKR